MKRLLLSAGLGVIAAAGLVLPAAAKTLVYCSEGSPYNFNPMLSEAGTTFDANRPVYDRLVDFAPGTTKVVPALAQSWTISKDGLTYTFKLRHGVKWHSNAMFKPTRDFNADDVLFSFNRQWKKDAPYHNVSGGSYDYFNDMSMPDLLASIDKVDDYTVKFTLKKPNAPFIADLAMDFASIQSAEYADALTKAGKQDLIDQQPIGTGPFEFVTYQKDSQIRYKAFPAYWGGKRKLDGLVFQITTDPAVREAKVRANECQVSPYPNPADIADLKKDKRLHIMEQAGLNIGYLAMNELKKPFDDLRVRQAINMAIDKKAIVAAVYQGAGQVAINPIPPTMWSYNKSVKDYPYDPAKAKALLAEAGYPNGFETDLWAMPVQRPYMPDAKKTAELMQADLAKIGIKANIVSYEWGSYLKKMQHGDHMMGIAGWTGDNGDPDNFLYNLFSCSAARIGGGNLSKWCDKSFDDLINKAAETSDIAQRTKLYEEAQVIFKKQASIVPIAHSTVFMVMRNNVSGYVMSPLGYHDFTNVTLK